MLLLIHHLAVSSSYSILVEVVSFQYMQADRNTLGLAHK
ncbi:hypothetical protein DET47_10688 [Shewanella putrefaciens]|nr:hypothetical protein DET47_10688 [Shewanella putrefaciens]